MCWVLPWRYCKRHGLDCSLLSNIAKTISIFHSFFSTKNYFLSTYSVLSFLFLFSFSVCLFFSYSHTLYFLLIPLMCPFLPTSHVRDRLLLHTSRFHLWSRCSECGCSVRNIAPSAVPLRVFIPAAACPADMMSRWFTTVTSYCSVLIFQASCQAKKPYQLKFSDCTWGLLTFSFGRQFGWANG